MLARINSLLVVLAITVLVLGATGVGQAGLVAYWNMNETGGSTLHDTSGDGYDATLVTSGGGTMPLPGQQGIIGDACRFYSGYDAKTGSGAIAGSALSPVTNISGSSVSVCAWFQFAPWTAGSNWNQPRLFQGQNNFDTLGFGNISGTTTPSTTSAYFYGNGGPNATGLSISGTSTWYQLTGTYDGSTATLYLNGVNVKTASSSGAWNVGNTVAISGVTSDGTTLTNQYSMNGLIDDEGVFSQSLTPTQVKAIYQVPHTFQTTGLNTAGTGNYGLADMQTLFNTFALGSGHSCVIGTGGNALTWQYATDLPTGSSNAGLAGTLGNGSYYVVLGDGGGTGMETAVPEPGTSAMLAAGLIGLLCYAWRKRK